MSSHVGSVSLLVRKTARFLTIEEDVFICELALFTTRHGERAGEGGENLPCHIPSFSAASVC